MSKPLKISAIGQIAINVHDLDRATDFYRHVLGLTFLFRAGNMAFLMCGEVRLMLGVAEKPEFDHPASILYLKVDDIHGAHASLVANDVTIDQEPLLVHPAEDHDLWMTFFRDSEDNVMALMSEVPR